MHRLFLPLLLLSTGLLAKPPQPPPDLLYVGPLDTAVVTVGLNVEASVLASAKARRHSSSDAALVAGGFYPAFGAAVSNAARKVEVIDASEADTRSSTSDSTRYVLVLTALDISQSTTTVPRRYMPPTPPAFDPATGMMNPGNRKGYAEGPGRVTTLTARARWVIWDNSRATARGTATGESSYRGAAGRAQWEEAARELAKDLLRQTAFTPF